MASIRDLPVELLTAIFRFACDRDHGPGGARLRLAAADRASLASFSLVHTAWTSPAQAILLTYVIVLCDPEAHAPGTLRDLERTCQRRLRPARGHRCAGHPAKCPNDTLFAHAIRTIELTLGRGAAADRSRVEAVFPTFDETWLSLCPNLVALCIDRSVTCDWDALASIAGALPDPGQQHSLSRDSMLKGIPSGRAHLLGRQTGSDPL